MEVFCESNGNASINSLQLATQIWSMTHGIATLEASQLINLFDRSIEPEALLDQSVRTLLAGAVRLSRLSGFTITSSTWPNSSGVGYFAPAARSTTG